MNKLLVIDNDTKENSIKVIQKLLDRYFVEIPMATKSLKTKIEKHSKSHEAYLPSNLFLLMRLFFVDILMLCKYFLSVNNVDEQNLFARLFYAQLYEFIEKVPKILGKKYRAYLETLPFGSVLLDELSKLIRVVNGYKTKNHEKFKLIRHNISSHKDIDGVLQVDLISVLDFNWVIVAYKDFIPIIVQFHDYEDKFIWIAENWKKYPGNPYTK